MQRKGQHSRVTRGIAGLILRIWDIEIAVINRCIRWKFSRALMNEKGVNQEEDLLSCLCAEWEMRLTGARRR